MDYLKILKDLQEYYSNLLIIQYNGKQKAKATIELIANLIWSNMALLQIRDAFDWRTASLAQLEIIGQWVGVSRAYNYSMAWNITRLSYPSYGTDTIAEADSLRGGYSDYSTFDTLDGGVITYKDLTNEKQQLEPEDFRTVIGLKIIKNNIVHNRGNIDEAIWTYFGGKTFYSESVIQVNSVLYTDEECTLVYGTVIDISGSSIEVIDENNEVLYSGYFNYYQKDDIYYYNLGHVYTTWQPHIITYHYPNDMANIINVCFYKNVLLAPTGVQIQLANY